MTKQKEVSMFNKNGTVRTNSPFGRYLVARGNMNTMNKEVFHKRDSITYNQFMAAYAVAVIGYGV